MNIYYVYDECVIKDRGIYNNTPELRQKLIKDNLDRHGIKGECNDRELSTYNIIKTHDVCYVNFLSMAYRSALEEADPDWLNDNKLIPNNYYRGNCSCDMYKIIDNLPCYRRSGYYCNDYMTPIIETTYQNAAKSANNSYIAAEMLYKNKDVVYYCLNSSPGHHAMSDGYGGYCFFNNGAIAANRLLELGANRVAILDLDYHAGNGTQEIFYKSKKVLTISIHADPREEYPTYSGFSFEQGIDEGLGYNINYEMRKKTRLNDYLAKVNDALDKIKKCECDFLVIAFGGDTFVLDPDGSNGVGFSLDLDDYYVIANTIKTLGLPILVTQEGGYNMEYIDQIVKLFLFGLAGTSLAKTTP